MALQLSMYSAYPSAGQNVLRPKGITRPKRRFDLASGVWRELPRKRLRLRKIAFILAAATSLYWLFAYHHRVHVPVTLSMVVTKDVPVYIDAAATVQAAQTVTVHAQMDGQLAEIAFKEGQDVKAGDVLARIDPNSLKIQYDEAMVNKVQDEAMLAKVKQELAKLKPLPHKTVKKETLKQLEEKRNAVRQFEATLQSDQVTIDTLKNQLSRSVIVSPIDGRTGIRQIDAGNMVHTADANGLVVISQMEPISVVFNLPEKKLHAIVDRLNQKEPIQILAMDADSRNVLDTGTLELVDNQVDAASGTIYLKANFPNHKRLLWPGGSVHIRLLESSLKNAVVVPATSVHYDNSKSEANPFVFVYSPTSQSIEMRIVKVAMTQDGEAVIQEGIHSGEQLVSESRGLLVDGSYVVPNIGK